MAVGQLPAMQRVWLAGGELVDRLGAFPPRIVLPCLVPEVAHSAAEVLGLIEQAPPQLGAPSSAGPSRRATYTTFRCDRLSQRVRTASWCEAEAATLPPETWRGGEFDLYDYIVESMQVGIIEQIDPE